MNQARPIDPEMTLLIPTLGRELLGGLLDSVVAGTRWPGRVVIVDQGRQPALVDLVTRARQHGLEIDYVPSERSGRSAGLNDGLARVDTPYVVVTDDDCRVAPDWIARLGDRLRRHGKAIVTGRVEACEGGLQLSVTTSTREVVQRRPSLRFDRLSGGNMAMPTDLVRLIGQFTEVPAIRTAEDGEFAYRALRAGIPIVYAPEAVVCHLGWRDEASRLEQYRSYASSQAGFFGYYLSRGDPFMLGRVLVHLSRSLRRWIVGSLTGDHDRAMNGRAYVTGLWSGLRTGWREGRAR